MTMMGIRGLAALALVGATMATAEARQGGRHADSGYGVASNPNETYALANVFSGIYGLRYSDDRERYDFNGCRARDIDVIVRPCR